MKTFLTSLLLFAITICTAQVKETSLKVTISNEYKDKVKSKDILSIASLEDGTTGIIRNSKKDLLFDIFDSNLNKVDSKQIESHRKETYVGDLFYGNEMKLFTVYAPKKDERVLYCHTLNLITKKHTKQELFKATVDKKQSLFGSRKNHNTNFSLSPNQEYFTIATDNVTKKKNSYTVYVFNAKTLELVFSKKYQESEEKYYTHNSLFVDNKGIVYSLGKSYKKGRSKKKLNGDANYSFVLNKISKNSTEDLIIELGDNHIKTLTISSGLDNINLVGFYSEKNTNRIKGGCTFSVNKNTLSLENTNKQVLPKSVFEDLYRKKAAERKNKKNKELSNFYIDYVITDTDNSTYVIAEEFYITTNYVSTGVNTGYYQNVYHYDDILILKFTPEGKISWGRSIFKKDNVPSYNVFLKDNKLHLIFNSGKRLTEKKDGRVKASKGFLESTSLFDFEYSSNGEVLNTKIQDNKGNTTFIPFYGNFNTGKFIMSSTGRRKKVFMMLE